jgi:ssDNA-binding Zn-finger/Zn-ribbon topoisomerase 1
MNNTDVKSSKNQRKSTRWFPCPVCLKPLDVRTSKRDKPYVICSPCGVQMFVRERAGITAFESLVDQGLQSDVLTRIGKLEQRYRKTCPECGKEFWALPDSVDTNWLNGNPTAYRCPQKNCSGIVPIGAEEDEASGGVDGKEQPK